MKPALIYCSRDGVQHAIKHTEPWLGGYGDDVSHLDLSTWTRHCLKSLNNCLCPHNSTTRISRAPPTRATGKETSSAMLLEAGTHLISVSPAASLRAIISAKHCGARQRHFLSIHHQSDGGQQQVRRFPWIASPSD